MSFVTKYEHTIFYPEIVGEFVALQSGIEDKEMNKLSLTKGKD